MKRALTIYENVFGLDHPDTVKILVNYVSLLWVAKRKSKAAEMQKRLEEIQAKMQQAQRDGDE